MQLGENVVVAGKFRLIRLLGRGGMGSVWQATHLALDIPCAVKFIEGDFANVPEMQARFQREAKAAAALRSPHVVQILDHDIFEGMPYIAMELLDGEELSKRIAKAGFLSPAETVAVIGQVCRALGKAHHAGIVHRDLKPDNLFLVHDDDRDIVKILDFGIAKSKNPNLDIGGNTKTGAMLGTPYYMSPEQAQGNKAIDGRSDLWALGVIVYECLTGTRPFESDALGDLLMQIMVKDLPLPSKARPGLPPKIDAWFQKACARDPKDRFQTAKELAEALATACDVGASTELMSSRERDNALARGATLPLNTPNPITGSGGYPAATAQPVLSAQTGPGVTPPPFVQADHAPAKKSIMPLVAGAVLLGALGIGAVVFAVTRNHDDKAQAGGAINTTATATAPATMTATVTVTSTAATETVAAAVTATATATATATIAAATVTVATTHGKPPASATGKPHPTATGQGTKPGTDLGF